MKKAPIVTAGATALALVLANGGSAQAQSSSLFGSPGVRPPLSLEGNSWYFLKVEPPKELQLNDIITVIIDEKSQVTSQGDLDRRKQATFDARLRDWVELDGLSLKPAPMKDGEPRARGSIDSKYRAEAELQTRDGMKFRIAVRVVDIRPNGHLVVEGHRRITNNEEVWEQSISGIVRREDVLPNNTILSEDVLELNVCKKEVGSVRDGYRRGFLMKAWDGIHAF